MSKTNLKIGPLPDRTPQKLTVLIDPPLAADLDDYARIHSEIHGVEVPVAALVPLMLETFLASDSGFRRARRS
ncbi:DUF2274 domain-containing protein [Hyphomonas sp.]|uniref:DUF2274 domain-containing protein n=1 Tax=Hyphomonas sp. TaxID=87 RepID=UPI003526F84A